MKILNSEKIYKAHVFDVEKIFCELPDGRQRYYDLVQHGPAVVLVPVTEDGKILFVKQYRLGAEKEILELPAGMINDKEEIAALDWYSHIKDKETIALIDEKLLGYYI